MLGRRVVLADGSGEATIEDVAIEESGLGEWEVGQLFVRKPKTGASPFGKGPTDVRAVERGPRAREARREPVGRAS